MMQLQLTEMTRTVKHLLTWVRCRAPENVNIVDAAEFGLTSC